LDNLIHNFKQTFSVESKISGSAVYKALFPYSFLGVGLYWTWIYTVCFSAMVFPQNENAIAFAQSSEYVSMLFYVLVLLVSALLSNLLTRGGMRAFKWLSVFPGLAGAGTLLMAISFSFMENAHLVMMLGAALTGLGTGALLNMWGLLFTQMRANYAPLRISLALLVSFVSYLLLSLLPFVAVVIITSLLPLISCRLLFVARNSTEFSSKKDTVSVTQENVKSIDQNYPWQLGIGLLSCGIPLGLLLGMTFVQVNMGYEVPLICIVVNACICVLILVYLAVTNRNLGFSTIYRIILPITICGLFLIASFQSQFIVLSLFLIRTGYALFDVLIWLQLQKVFSSTGTFKMFGLSRLCLDGGVFVGLTLHRFVISNNPELFNVIIFWSAVFLVFTLPVVLTRRRVANAWFLLPASSKEAEDFDIACREIAERQCLTKRETEIMALIARGRNGTYIQGKLFISLNTFQTHSRNIYRKLSIHSRQELMSLFDTAINRSKSHRLVSIKHHDDDKE
jgi:DNA-binding CsgD family transcriptional regulator